MTKELSKAEIKASWLKELRSGNHKQARETLVEEFEDGSLGYCCLGILACKVLSIEEQPNSRDEFGLIDEGSKDIYSKTKRLLELWEIKENSEAFFIDANVYLTDLNDDLEWDFEQIADAIEKHWEVD